MPKGDRLKSKQVKQEFLTEARKLIKAAMILDIYTYHKHNSLQPNPTTLKDFTFTFNLIPTYSRDLQSNHKSTHTVKQLVDDTTTPYPFKKKVVDGVCSVGISSVITENLAMKLLKDKPVGFTRKFTPAELEFTQSTCTDEEVEWARYVLTDYGFKLSNYHLDEQRYRLVFKRLRTIVETYSETVWLADEEAAKTKHSAMISAGYDLGKTWGPSWTVEKTVDSSKKIEFLPGEVVKL